MKTRLASALALLALAAPLDAAVIEQIMVRVNNSVITRAQFEKRRAQSLASMQRSLSPEDYAEAVKSADVEILRRMTEEYLLIERARQTYDLEKLVDFQVDNFMQSNGIATKSDLEARLAGEGMTVAQFRDDVLHFAVPDFVRSREIRGSISIPRSEMQAYYDAHAEDFTGHGRRYAGQLVFDPARHPDPAEQRARIEAVLQSDKPFPELAKGYSDAANAAAGGDLGLVSRGELRKELDAALFGAEKPGLIGPIEAAGKVYWLYLAKIEGEGLLPFEDAIPDIERKLVEERFPAAAEKFMLDLWNRNHVVVAAQWRAIIPAGAKVAGGR